MDFQKCQTIRLKMAEKKLQREKGKVVKEEALKPGHSYTEVKGLHVTISTLFCPPRMNRMMSASSPTSNLSNHHQGISREKGIRDSKQG